jgi:methylenetetrahydrofolate dehydrogenase (NADP+) / methenyltetrahydrofolate cyclohydrolase
LDRAEALMSARILDGRALAERRNEETRARIESRLADLGRPPRLDVILIGNDAASHLYVRRKEGAARKAGIDTQVHHLEESATAADIRTALEAARENERVDGIVLQLPLPAGKDPRAFFPMIPLGKDVDGLNPLSQGLLLQGNAGSLVPATPLAVRWLIAEAGLTLRGVETVIVSHSNLIGKPLAALLVNEDATVTICHKHTRDLAAHTRRAGLLITAAGVPGLITKDHVREGATVIDAATVHDAEGRLVGDCAADIGDMAAFITPVPGGVGPVTVAALLANTVQAWLGAHKEA